MIRGVRIFLLFDFMSLKIGENCKTILLAFALKNNLLMRLNWYVADCIVCSLWKSLQDSD